MINEILNPDNFPLLQELLINRYKKKNEEEEERTGDEINADILLFNQTIADWIRSKKNTLTILTIADIDELDDVCIVDHMLPALKECFKLEQLVFNFNKTFQDVETVNVLLKELPDSLKYLEVLENGVGESKWLDYDEELVDARIKRAWNFDVYISDC